MDGLVLLVAFGFGAAMACIPGAIAAGKGRSFFGFWCLSFFVPFGFFIALIWTLAIRQEPRIVLVERVQAAQ